MVNNDLNKLAAVITQEHHTLLARWRQQVRRLPAAEYLDTPALNDHIPRILEELATALNSKSDETIPEALREGSPPAHGLQRFEDGFGIAEVVAEYNILRGCIHDLALENGLNLQGKPFHIVNRVLDGAIGLAVQAFAAQQALEVRGRREEYLTFVAHDLRTPLNAISLAVSLLEMSLPQRGVSDHTVQTFRTLSRNVVHLTGLVNKVVEENTNLQAENGIKLERRVFDLWPLVEAVIQDLSPVAGAGSTELVNKVPHDLVVYADASLLRRVFQNLIGNAIKYTPGGQVTIWTREVGTEGAVECSVSDNGAGIPAVLLDKVFEKGETDPEEKEGTGLGLAIVKTFIEAHGGAVIVESNEGRGSTFRFSLPSKIETPGDFGSTVPAEPPYSEGF
jgi:signal transduction histidine kinase